MGWNSRQRAGEQAVGAVPGMTGGQKSPTNRSLVPVRARGGWRWWALDKRPVRARCARGLVSWGHHTGGGVKIAPAENAFVRLPMAGAGLPIQKVPLPV